MTADVPVPDDEPPPVVPALRSATRIGAGPWVEDVELAIGAGFVDFEDGRVGVVRELPHRRTRFVLASAPPRGSPIEHDDADMFESLWLAEVESRTDDEDDVTEHRRVAAILLYDQAMPSQPLDSGTGATTTPFTCSVEGDLRARDIDGDREIEVTVIAPYLQRTREEWQGGGTPDECGAVAFIVGTDDWNVQASFTREYAVEAFAASIEVGEKRETTWQLRDVDADGHADLHVIERWRFLDNFMGDYVGDGETMPASRGSRSDRRELDCIYSVERDAWSCPAPAPGRLLFEDGATRGTRRGVRPW